MGGSSMTSNIFKAVPSADETISPVDELVIGYQNEHNLAHIRRKRYQLAISCIQLMSTYLDLCRLKDELMDKYNEESKAPKLKLRLLSRMSFNQSKGYKEIIRKAKHTLKISSKDVMKSINKNIMPRVKILHHDFRICIEGCKEFVNGHLHGSLPEEYRDEEMCARMQLKMLPFLEYCFHGFAVFERQLFIMQKHTSHRRTK